MKHSVKIPKQVKVAGFNYKVLLDRKAQKSLDSANRYGACSYQFKELELGTRWGPEQFSSTFIHEVQHAINQEYNNANMEEEENDRMAKGWFQVLESLGVRFVRE